jgi:hypothetical protein
MPKREFARCELIWPVSEKHQLQPQGSPYRTTSLCGTIIARRALLRRVARVSGVSVRILGLVDDAAASFTTLPSREIISSDPVSFWRDTDVIHRLGSPETQVLYCGGAWLEEEVLVAALSAVQIGYDTRVLRDVCVARTLFERASALEA